MRLVPPAVMTACIALGGCFAVSDTPAGKPAMAAYFDCVRERGVAISAHRGQSADDQPENSIAAILATGQAIPGAIVELDVVRTRDRKLVLMHDPSVDRTTTGHGHLAELTLSQVRQMRLRAPNGNLTDAAPPTLEEALAAAGRVGAIAALDFKADDEEGTLELARAVIAEVRRVNAADRAILITYSDTAARKVAEMAPEMMISAGLGDAADLSGVDSDQILAWTGSRTTKPSLWRRLKAEGLEVQFGTLGAPGERFDDKFAQDGDVGEYRDLWRKGVTVIATDTPLAVKSVMGPELAAAQTCSR